ncbi:MAG: DUF4153 domain-containing protein [bacterium]|nr:DUF4153 domain-containing protein [Candidatus Kapabacteria bacterium]
MRIFSAFRQLPERSLSALVRFPVALIAGVFLAGVIIRDESGGNAERLLMAALVGIIIAFDLTLIKERLGPNGILGDLVVLIASVACVALVWWTIDVVPTREGALAPYDRIVAGDEPIRIMAIAFALHALAAVIPFVGRPNLSEFWDFNRRLFLRTLSAALFSGVLFAGLAVALWAVDELLTVDVDGKTYTDLFAIMLGVICTWFFLAGVPTVAAARADSTESDAADAVARDNAPVNDATYPRGLRVFVQFVLLPLTVVYLIILYLYALRITIEWQLPEGQVSYLIFSYAVVGILAYLLIYPLRDEEENQWVRRFARGFFIALAPLLIVLIVALARRIGDYGLTEARYYGVALSAWLALMVVYFLTRREDIRVIPATLAVMALLTIAGPWGASAVAVRSQLNELRVMAKVDSLTERDITRVLSISYFLYERDRITEGAVLRTSRPDTVSSESELASLFGVDPIRTNDDHNNLHLTFRSWRTIEIGGYSQAIEIVNPTGGIVTSSGSLGPIDVRLISPGLLRIVATGDSLLLRLDSLTVVQMHLEPPRRSNQPRKMVTDAHDDGLPTPFLEDSSRVLRAKLAVRWISGTRHNDSVASVSDFSGLLLVGRRDGR